MRAASGSARAIPVARLPGLAGLIRVSLVAPLAARRWVTAAEVLAEAQAQEARPAVLAVRGGGLQAAMVMRVRRAVGPMLQPEFEQAARLAQAAAKARWRLKPG